MNILKWLNVNHVRVPLRNKEDYNQFHIICFNRKKIGWFVKSFTEAEILILMKILILRHKNMASKLIDLYQEFNEKFKLEEIGVEKKTITKTMTKYDQLKKIKQKIHI